MYNTYIYVYVYIYVCVYIYIYVYIHTYIYVINRILQSGFVADFWDATLDKKDSAKHERTNEF